MGEVSHAISEHFKLQQSGNTPDRQAASPSHNIDRRCQFYVPVFPSGDRFQVHNILRSTCCAFNTQHRSTLPISGPWISFRGPISSSQHLTIDMLCLQYTTPIDTASFTAQATPFRLSISSPNHLTIDMLCLQHTTPIDAADFKAQVTSFRLLISSPYHLTIDRLCL